MHIRQIVNILAVAVTLAVNGAANAVPFNGRTTGEVSDSFPVLFVPAGYVFGIWGIIYLLLVAFAVYQALPGQRDDRTLAAISPWFVASCALNALWIFLWHYGFFVLTLVVMLALLGCLLAIYLRLDRPTSFGRGLTVNLPFSVYLGWISVATIANFSTVLYSLGFNGGALGPEPWALALLLIATVLGAAMIVRRREIAYPLVLVWAFVGIWQKQAAGAPAVATAALVAAAALAALLVAARIVLRQPRLAGQG